MHDLKPKDYSVYWQLLFKAYKNGGQDTVNTFLIQHGLNGFQLEQLNINVFNSFSEKEQIKLINTGKLTIYSSWVKQLVHQQKVNVILAVFENGYNFKNYIWTVLMSPMGKNIAFMKKFLKLPLVNKAVSTKQIDIYWGQLNAHERTALASSVAKFNLSDKLFIELSQLSIENLKLYIEHQDLSDRQVDLLTKDQLCVLSAQTPYPFMYNTSHYLILKLVEVNAKLITPSLFELLPLESIEDLTLLLKIYKSIDVNNGFDNQQQRYYKNIFKEALMNNEKIQELLTENNLNFVKLTTNQTLNIIEKLIVAKKTTVLLSVNNFDMGL